MLIKKVSVDSKRPFEFDLQVFPLVTPLESDAATDRCTDSRWPQHLIVFHNLEDQLQGMFETALVDRRRTVAIPISGQGGYLIQFPQD